MNSNLDDLILKTKLLSRKGSADAALSLANQLVERYPNDMRVWALRAHLYDLKEDYSNAIADLTRAIEINAAEPHLFYTRGTCRFALGENQSAADDFSKGLELCDYHNNDYYRGELHFWRAEALLKLGKKQEALADLAHVAEDHASWTDQLRTKSDLLNDCYKLPG